MSISLFFRWIWNLVDYALLDMMHEEKIFQATGIFWTLSSFLRHMQEDIKNALFTAAEWPATFALQSLIIARQGLYIYSSNNVILAN